VNLELIFVYSYIVIKKVNKFKRRSSVTKCVINLANVKKNIGIQSLVNVYNIL